jgi:hypothetical protein
MIVRNAEMIMPLVSKVHPESKYLESPVYPLPIMQHPPVMREK